MVLPAVAPPTLHLRSLDVRAEMGEVRFGRWGVGIFPRTGDGRVVVDVLADVLVFSKLLRPDGEELGNVVGRHVVYGQCKHGRDVDETFHGGRARLAREKQASEREVD